jgi:hypothetical protein
MSAVAVERRLPPALPGVYADPPSPDGLKPHPATVTLVRDVVRDLLADNQSFRALDAEDRVALARNLVSVGSYLAECVRDDWFQSERLQQRPLIRTRTPALATAQAAGSDFNPAAANQIGRVTTETLRAVAFPVFVADLIKGTFNAISDASYKQMQSYMQLLEDVSKTVDDYTDDSVSDDEARRWLAERYPGTIRVSEDGRAVPGPNAGADNAPNFADLDLSGGVDATDGSQIEQTLVPAARRKLAQSRLKLLSTLVLMGVSRIVVTGGKIRATMGFHINTRDTAHQESASQFQFGTSASGSFGAGPWAVAASMSVAYVSSTKADSNAELSTQTDLTGEVEIHFQSDYFPIERFSTADGIDKIRANTPVPATNTPMTPVVRDNIPWGDSSPPQQVERLGTARQPSQTPFSAIPASPVAVPPIPKTEDELKREKAASDKAAGDKAAVDKAAADKKAADEKAAREKKEADAKAAQEKTAGTQTVKPPPPVETPAPPPTKPVAEAKT